MDFVKKNCDKLQEMYVNGPLDKSNDNGYKSSDYNRQDQTNDIAFNFNWISK